MSERGPKELTGKCDWSVFPFLEAQEVVRVFEYGAKKYGQAFTYRKGIPSSELLAAIIRHCVELQNGNLVDEESGCLHASHGAANFLMLISQYANNAKMRDIDNDGMGDQDVYDWDLPVHTPPQVCR